MTGYTRAVIRTTRRHVTTLATDRLYSHGRRTTLFFSLLSLCKYKNIVYSIVQSPRDKKIFKYYINKVLNCFIILYI